MPRYSLACLFILFLPLLSLASSAFSDTLLVSEIKGEVKLKSVGKGAYYYSSATDPSEVLTLSGWGNIGSTDPGKKEGHCWIRFAVKNDLSDSAYVDLLPFRADSAFLYIVDGGVPLDYQVTGRFIQPAQWLVPEQPEIGYLFIAPGQTVTVLLRLAGDRRLPFSLKNFVVQSRAHTLQKALEGNRKYVGRLEMNAFFFGTVISMMLFFLLYYFRVREKSLLFYALYLLGAACYALIVSSLPYSRMAWTAGIDYDFAYKLNDPVQYLFLASYILFAIHLLDIDHRYRVLRNVMYTMVAGLILTGVFLLLTNLVNYDYTLQKRVYVMMRTVILPLAVVVIVWIALDVKSPIKRFFLAGCFFFAGSGIVAFLMDLDLNLFPVRSDLISPVTAFKAGMLVEIFCFSIGLVYKMKLITDGKEKVQAAYIEQMELSRSLVEGENERLERMAEKRAEEIVEANTMLERQERQKLESDFDRKLSEMEMQGLRSQMNPEFIFNCLNSIRALIDQGDYEQANDYLMRFSRFLRQTLQNSRKPQVSLAEELKVVSLYLQLEKLRLGNLFEYTVTVSPEIDTEDVTVPSMLLQPFAENALKHGIAPNLKKAGRIDVRIEENDLGYRYELEDNGIGREVASLKKSPEQKDPPGLKLIADRIDMFNRNFKEKLQVSIEDLKNASGEPTGTRVVIAHDVESDD